MIEFEGTQASYEMYNDKRQFIIVQENYLDNIKQQSI